MNNDRLIKDALKEEYEEIKPTLSSNEAWELFTKKKRKSSSYIPKKRFIYLAACIAVFLTIFFITPQSGYAFNKVFDFFHTIQGNVMQLFITSNNDINEKNSPSDEEFALVEDSEIISESMTLDEAQKITAFPILTPKWLPGETDLQDVTVIREVNGESEEIYLNYNGDETQFQIRELTAAASFGFGAALDQEDAVLEEVMIHSYQGNLLTFKNDSTQLLWITEDHFLSIEGNLTKEQIMEVAESM